MAGDDNDVIWIGGYAWRKSIGTHRDQPTYSIEQVKQAGGDPERLRRDGVTYSNGTYTKDSTR